MMKFEGNTVEKAHTYTLRHLVIADYFPNRRLKDIVAVLVFNLCLKGRVSILDSPRNHTKLINAWLLQPLSALCPGPIRLFGDPVSREFRTAFRETDKFGRCDFWQNSQVNNF